jgi:hypothetical protein
LKRLSLYSALVLLVGVFSSCSDISNPTAPLAQNQAVTSTPLSSVSLLALPRNARATLLAKIVTQEVLITRAAGGDVPVSYTYPGQSGKSVTVVMNLHFDANTVKADTKISIALDTETLMADFLPSGTVFDKDAILTAKVSGLDLTGVTNGVNLYYINNVVCQQMNGSVSIDPLAGTLDLKDGRIPHFSLYGFGFLK